MYNNVNNGYRECEVIRHSSHIISRMVLYADLCYEMMYFLSVGMFALCYVSLCGYTLHI